MTGVMNCVSTITPNIKDGVYVETDPYQNWWDERRRDIDKVENLIMSNIHNVADWFEMIADREGDRVALKSISDNISWTYKELDAKANQVAHWAYEYGLREGECAALCVENSLMFIAATIGLAKVGIRIGLLNIAVMGRNFEAAQDAIPCKCLIISDCLYEKNKNEIKIPFMILDQNVQDPAVDFLAQVSKKPLERPPRDWRQNVNIYQELYYIFTSGTTGVSKAAKFSHIRYIGAGITWAKHMRLTKNDLYYNALPLYHGNGGVVAISTAFYTGCCLIIRKKFSVSNFWSEMDQYGCTAMVYIGELWTYLCAHPSSSKRHTLRVICGNGLRANLWETIFNRFKVKLIVEHYGQTEMPSGHLPLNSFNKIGACCWKPPNVERWDREHIEHLVEWDQDTGLPIRGPKGFFIDALRNEDGCRKGLAIVKVDESYLGYANQSDTEKVLYRDCFEVGDTWYCSGDVLREEADGFVYFVDRAGDTYRWKSENVSTYEVEVALQAAPGVIAAFVWGVSVPNHDGKAGMAALQLEVEINEENLNKVLGYLNTALPNYSIPRFIHILTNENTFTSTMKFQKGVHKKAGFDLKALELLDGGLRDRVYVLKDHRYELLSEGLVMDLENGVLKL